MAAMLATTTAITNAAVHFCRVLICPCNTVICRLSNVPVRELSTFPLRQLLLACTSLDGAQADALIAGLTQEWALIQGPPGTGELLLQLMLLLILISYFQLPATLHCTACKHRVASWDW
jgi:hypothetical protein